MKHCKNVSHTLNLVSPVMLSVKQKSGSQNLRAVLFIGKKANHGDLEVNGRHLGIDTSWPKLIETIKSKTRLRKGLGLSL